MVRGAWFFSKKGVMLMERLNNGGLVPFSVKLLVFLSIIMGGTLFMSNLAALKIWNFFGIPVDAGILLFPISYIVGDLLVEFYKQKVADYVATCAAIFAVIASGIMLVAKILPDYPDADNTAFSVVQSATGRIFLASVAGFIASQLLNNHVFMKIRKNMAGYRLASLASSGVARIADIAIFETLAFFGKLSLTEFLIQASFAYLAGMILEAILSIPSGWLVGYLHLKVDR